jgi:hypothetical protein
MKEKREAPPKTENWRGGVNNAVMNQQAHFHLTAKKKQPIPAIDWLDLAWQTLAKKRAWRRL